MGHKSLINQLQLGYMPLTAYEFAQMKNDPNVVKALRYASLYVIAQRPVITFEKMLTEFKNLELTFEIHQKGNTEILKCKLPLDQEAIGITNDEVFELRLNQLDRSVKQKTPPFYNIHGFSILRRHNERKSELLAWLSPEKLLRNVWNDNIDCEIEGDYKSFLKYHVHYVGKATKQNIIKRLTGHSTFQDILSLESPVTEKQLPANEIIVLCFDFQDNFQIQSFGGGSDSKEMVAAVMGENYPDLEKVFLDAEKALIKAMKPKYNKELFEKYPISKDGLYKDKYDAISYTFTDPITLIYPDGEIRGGFNFLGGDSIVILNNKEIKLVKA